MNSITFKTYAKINLSLDITGLRNDGYHEVCMVMHGIDLWDEMRVAVNTVSSMDQNYPGENANDFGQNNSGDIGRKNCENINENPNQSTERSNANGVISCDAGGEADSGTDGDAGGGVNSIFGTDAGGLIAPVQIVLAADKEGIPLDSKNTAYKAAQVIVDEYPEAVGKFINFYQIQADQEKDNGKVGSSFNSNSNFGSSNGSGGVNSHVSSNGSGGANSHVSSNGSGGANGHVSSNGSGGVNGHVSGNNNHSCHKNDSLIFCVEIDIKKNIPAAAGLAGGSSNAAGVLLALNKLLNLNLSLNELCRLGKKVGADVPFCVMTIAAANSEFGVVGGSACALSEGIGEILTPLPSVDAWILLAKPVIEVSTSETYKDLDTLDWSSFEHPDTPVIMQGIKSGDLNLVKQGMINVLENVTLIKYHEVSELKGLMKKYNSEMTLMSGSGPTVFSVFEAEKTAKDAFISLKKELFGTEYEIFCAKTL